MMMTPKTLKPGIKKLSKQVIKTQKHNSAMLNLLKIIKNTQKLFPSLKRIWKLTPMMSVRLKWFAGVKMRSSGKMKKHVTS